MFRRLGLAIACVLATSAAAQNDAPDGVFSAAQAERGATVFARHCAECHTTADAAEKMMAAGAGMTLLDYHARLSAIMPPMSEIRPEPQDYLDVMAYLLRTAGARPGSETAGLGHPALRTARIAPSAAQARPVPAQDVMEWRHWRGDIGGTAYAPGAQIDAGNAGALRVVWRWKGANMGPSPEARSITTPIMVDGVLYVTAGQTRNVVAIDARTGETLWLWRPNEDKARFDNAPRKGAGRGVAYWSDAEGDARIFTITPGFSLAALDARTGRPVPGFGRNGVVDLMEGLRGAPRDELADIGSSSPPLVIGDVVVVGAAHEVGLRPRSKVNVKGDVRAFDARTGRLLWTFRTIPARGEPGYETWEGDSAEYSGNAGVWAPMSADPATGTIFLPVEASTSDVYGGERPGQNLHSSSLVALDARTGRLRWARQLVHHDIWDWDVPAIPILADIPQNGGAARRAVLQITKQGFVFAFDRDTGEPIWPIEERPVPASDVPGERAWPTQPMPAKPLPFDRQGVTVDDLIDFTPGLRAQATESVRPYRLGAFMAPPSLANAPDGTRGTISLPSVLGGGNWEGGAFDPETGLLYVASMTQPSVLALAPARDGSDIRYVSAGGRLPNIEGLPIIKPPYGRITAIDMKSGDHAWMMANADTPARIRDNPALAGLDIGRTGVPSRAGLLVTRTLLFAGEGPGGSAVLRAHDKQAGAIVAEIALPGPQTGLPMSYVLDGRQYIALAVAAEGGAEIVALALPE